MFGKNPIRSIVNDQLNLAVESHFYTIQGEGPLTGCPALFIRLAGCNLACHFCDTQFDTKSESPEPVEQLMTTLLSQYTDDQRKIVVITGGEPFRQDFSRLATALLSSGTQQIQIETAGTLWQPNMEPWLMTGQVMLVCSPKTPKIHPSIAKYCRHYKYIVTAGELSQLDGLPNRGTQISTKDKELILYRPRYAGDWVTVWVSPCDAYDEYDALQNKANMIAARDSALKFGYRVNLQIHKLLGVE